MAQTNIITWSFNENDLFSVYIFFREWTGLIYWPLRSPSCWGGGKWENGKKERVEANEVASGLWRWWAFARLFIPRERAPRFAFPFCLIEFSVVTVRTGINQPFSYRKYSDGTSFHTLAVTLLTMFEANESLMVPFLFASNSSHGVILHIREGFLSISVSILLCWT